MKYVITRNDSSLKGEVSLSPSKTIGNKVVLFRVLKSSHITQRIATEQEDANVVNHNLFADGVRKRNGNVYKSIRYVRAVLKYFGGEWVLSSSDILKGRSASKIVKILRQFDLDVAYEIRTGRPPIKVIGKNVRGSVVRVDGMINSKMLEAKFIFPSNVSNEAVINLKDAVFNSTYTQLTLRALQQLGVNTDWNIDEVLIEHEVADGSDIVVESDWSMASYLYMLVALSKRATIKINGLNAESIQPDLAVKDIFASLGVETEQLEQGIIIKRRGSAIKEFTHNFVHYPDLIPAVIATCVCKKIPFTISGGDALRKKEVDRINALQVELQKLGATIKVVAGEQGETISFDGKSNIGKVKDIEFETYNDQRVALALSLIVATGTKLTIHNPQAANISYFNFWDDLEKLGFFIVKE